jgi:hypothetical protein
MSFVFKAFFIILALFVAGAFSQAFDAKNTVISGADLTNSQTGVESTFTLTLRSASNTPISSCHMAFDAVMKSAKGAASVSCECQDGETVCTYLADVAGDYEITVEHQGAHVTTFNVQVAAAAYVPLCYAFNYTSIGFTGNQYYFKIQSMDIDNQTTTACLSNWEISFTTGANTFSGLYINCSNGISLATYTPPLVGNYLMYVKQTGQYIANSPLPFSFTSDVLDPDYLIADGPGATGAVAGQNATVIIQAQNSFGVDVTICDNTVTFSGDLTPVPPQTGPSFPIIYDGTCKDGVYSMTYNATKTGQYDLNINFESKPIQNSGKVVTITPSMITDPTRTTVVGPGISQAIVGNSSAVQITSYDFYGNLINTCRGLQTYNVQLNVDGVLTSGKNLACSTGVLTYVYTATKSGVGALTISLNSINIPGSPFTVNVIAGIIDWPYTAASGDGLSTAYAGVNATFYVQPYDQYDNIILVCISNPFTTYINSSASSDKIPVYLVDCNNGLYTYSYVLQDISVSYILAIEYNGNPIEDSPYTINLGPGYPSASHCTISGDGLSTATAGVVSYFSMSCSDEFGNPISACYPNDAWTSTLSGPTTYDVGVVNCTNGSTVANQSLTYFSYEPFVAGLYELDISIYGENITTSSVTVAPGPVNPSGSTADGPGVTSQDLIAGIQTSFYVYTSDLYGNKISRCDNQTITATFKSKGKDVPIAVTNFECVAGNTTLLYTPTIAEQLFITVTIDGQSIAGNPYSVIVNSGPLVASTIVADGTGLKTATAGINATFNMKGSDQFGNKVDNCIDPVSNFDITLVLYSTTVPVVVTCSSGTFYGTYYPTISGKYNMTITYSNAPIQNGPFYPVVSPSFIQESMSSVTGPGFTQVPSPIAGDNFNFVVQATDAFGNTIDSCLSVVSGFWTATFVQPNGKVYTDTTTNCLDGKYTFNENFSLSGLYNVSIIGTQSKTPALGSPKTFTIVPSSFFPETSVIVAPANATIGENVILHIQTVDKFGNVITVCPESINNSLWTITAVDSANFTFGYVTGCQSGLISASIQVNISTTYHVYVKYNGIDLSNSPVTIDWGYGYAYAAFSLASGAGVTPNIKENIAGELVYFHVTSYNEYNIQIPICFGNDTDWQVTFNNPISNYTENQHVQRSNCTDGVTPFRYNATNAGTFLVTIRYGVTDIQGSPYSVDIYPAEIDPKMTVVTGVSSGSDNGTFFVIPRDRFGNDETDDINDYFEVNLSPFCANTTVNQKITTDGRIQVDYSVAEGGIYCVVIYYKGYALNIGETTIHAVGGTACESRCNYNGYCFQDNFDDDDDDDGLEYACSCFQGYVSEDCSVDFDKYPMQTGAIVGLVIGLSLLLFIIGLLLGWCVIGRFMAKNDQQEERSPLLA